MYVRPLDPKIDRPVQELKSFQRVSLLPGRKAAVTLMLDAGAFSYWDDIHHQWQTDPGRYELEVGSSSRDIRLRAIVRVPGSVKRL